MGRKKNNKYFKKRGYSDFQLLLLQQITLKSAVQYIIKTVLYRYNVRNYCTNMNCGNSFFPTTKSFFLEKKKTVKNTVKPYYFIYSDKLLNIIAKRILH